MVGGDYSVRAERESGLEHPLSWVAKMLGHHVSLKTNLLCGSSGDLA